jgi:hypothetical protein
VFVLPPFKKHRAVYLITGSVILVILLMCCVGFCAPDNSDKAVNIPNNLITSTSPKPILSVSPSPVEPEVELEPEPVVTKVNKKFNKLTSRQWKKVAKAPNDYITKQYIVYGVVTQFDTSTSAEAFRANVDGVNKEYDYEYNTNTILDNNGVSKVLDDVVEGDEFRAKVIVNGEFTYESTMGAELAVPHLSVVSIKIL